MVRTRSEEHCVNCGQKTNWYDDNLGRWCPRCVALFLITMSKNREASRSGPPFVYYSIHSDLQQGDIDYLAEPKLLNMPLIDHNNDIDADKK